MKKYICHKLGLLVLIILVSISFAKTSLAAADATLSLIVTPQTVNVGDPVTLVAKVNRGSNTNVRAVDIYIEFDADVLELNSIVNDGVFNTEMANNIPPATAAGTATFGTAQFGGSAVAAGAQTVATFNFTALSGGVDSAVNFTAGTAVWDSGLNVTDAGGLTGALITVVADTIAPDTTISGQPTDPSDSADADFTFTSSEPNSTFECDMDGAGFGACTSPKSYTSLGEGPHTFQVRATDEASNVDATPASYSWDIDTIAPSTTIAINPTDPSNSADADFTFTSSEPSSTFECDMDGAGFGACTSPKSYTSLGEGPHTFQVRATDEASNVDATPASYAWDIDTISPTISLTSPANGSIINDSTPALTYLVSDGTVVVKVDDIVVVKTSGQSLDALSDASHTITIESTDSAGNINTTTNTFTVDTIAPNTTISSQPSDPSITASASLEFSAEIGATFECKLDSGSYAACTSLKAYTGLADGSHTFLVRAIDTATNVDASPASYTWTIDLPPVIGSGSPAEVLSSGTTQIAIGVETNKNAICKYATTSGNAYSAMTIFDGTGSTTHSFTATGLADGGSYGYFVRCQGGNNNVNLTDYLVSFSVAAPAPVVIQAAAASSSSKSSSHNDKKKKVSSHTITNSKKSITRGATLIQRGKKFSKNNYVLLYFTKYGGGYYAPQKIKTSSSGAFITKYVINKPKGTYGWYALDIKTGKKSKTVYYKVK